MILIGARVLYLSETHYFIQTDSLDGTISRRPETIHDICASFQVHFGRDLSEFRRHSRACIVKFRDDRVQQRALGIALSYLWCWHHEGNCTKCDTCYESGGNSIDAYSIEQIEEVADQDVPE